MTRSRTLLLILLCVVVTAYAACRRWEADWYQGLIPAAIETDGIVVISDQGGFREGCGAVVFKLSAAALVKLDASGLGALASAHEARSHPREDYFRFGDWQQTPYVESGDGLTLADRWLVGLNCADLDPALGKQIHEAINTKGSFYATSRESGLVVIPSRGLVLLAYEG